MSVRVSSGIHLTFTKSSISRTNTRPRTRLFGMPHSFPKRQTRLESNAFKCTAIFTEQGLAHYFLRGLAHATRAAVAETVQRLPANQKTDLSITRRIATANENTFRARRGLPLPDPKLAARGRRTSRSNATSSPSNTRTLPHGRHVCYCTRKPRNDRSGHARSIHVGTPVHVYTLPTAGSPTYGRVGCYATVHARAPYTWAHPPTCAPYTTVGLLASARAPVVILHI